MAKNHQKVGFNFIGHFYNFLKALFLLNATDKVIANTIQKLNIEGRVLVIGGGADNSVLEILKKPKVSNITHLDLSEVLSNKAREKLKISEIPKVEFVVSSFLDWEETQNFDWIVCPFYLDLFSDLEVRLNLKKIKSRLGENGSVSVIDFDSHKSILGKILVLFLYAMFYPITGNFRKGTPDFKTLFRKEGFVLTKEFNQINRNYQSLVLKIKR